MKERRFAIRVTSSVGDCYYIGRGNRFFNKGWVYVDSIDSKHYYCETIESRVLKYGFKTYNNCAKLMKNIRSMYEEYSKYSHVDYMIDIVVMHADMDDRYNEDNTAIFTRWYFENWQTNRRKKKEMSHG